mmetsp:Transcript_26755/g.39580  ORF Transcript_26755/g.39580 Transcript_26755/m.39580 type:complete len:409 (+) Transcript_26755:110-1336(+)|eukprot:CAMPEP_0194215108 /NCGR_PEP_ID=MMETSP0156-20130528/16637_1 /TAXON_ID=33649 /ORGANISM="Thalassionema nitzschioides, Strain L26-B" /LENGTH=408 /DNA_ID=CAMNT_0038943535 /DNA_START=69 /DNA_END=1295 /DNA_ORIENTATION=+
MSIRVVSILILLCLAACASSAPLQIIEVFAFVRGGADGTGRISEGGIPDWSNSEEDPDFDQTKYSIDENIEKKSTDGNKGDDDITGEDVTTGTEKEIVYAEEESTGSDDVGVSQAGNEFKTSIKEKEEDLVVDEEAEDLVSEEEKLVIGKGDGNESDAKGFDDRGEEREIEIEEPWEQNEYQTNFEAEVIHHTIDDDSSAFVDREELADAYDDDETAVSSPSLQSGYVEKDDRASIDDIPRLSTIQDYEETNDSKEENDIVTEEESSPGAMDDAVIPIETQRILIKECGFKKSEIKGLKIHIANVIAQKMLRRPLDGIPTSWYNEKKRLMSKFISVRKMLSVAIPAAIGAVAVYGVFESFHASRISKKESIAFEEDEVQEEHQNEEALVGSQNDQIGIDRPGIRRTPR